MSDAAREIFPLQMDKLPSRTGVTGGGTVNPDGSLVGVHDPSDDELRVIENQGLDIAAEDDTRAVTVCRLLIEGKVDEATKLAEQLLNPVQLVAAPEPTAEPGDLVEESDMAGAVPKGTRVAAKE
jgi:hypothetical protein